jgi:23S rRNA pseudouridine1911/1915/1917 synthase
VDARVIAVDKPGGVAGHALDPRQRGTVAAALLARWPALAGVGDPLAPGLVHRLDTGTSGVLLAARTAEAFDALRALFRAHAVRKRYVAVVRGAPRPGTRIDAPLAHDTRDRRRMVAAGPGARAWPAETTIVAVHPCGDVSRIDVEIRTGVTHQIRAHLALAGHPVVGDALYGGPPATTLAPGRHALHAARVEIPSWPLEVEAPLPADVRDLAGRG